MSTNIKKNRLNIRIYSLLFLLSFFISTIPYPTQAQSNNSILLKINDYSKEVFYEEYSTWFSHSANLITNPLYDSEIENINYCMEAEIICKLSNPIRNRFHIQKISIPIIEDEKVKTSLEKIAIESKKDPTNAKFEMENNKVSVFKTEESGYIMDTEKSLQKIKEFLSQDIYLTEKIEIEMPYSKIFPEIKTEDLNKLGINTLIGQGKSNFKGSPKSRIHNIKTATKKYDGVLIAPNEEFSFVEALGPVDGENGYLPELVIKYNKTEPEFGGGICQVSTTVFRAAIYSGLEITARKNHAYPVQYYNPQGLDATIYIPKPDLKFKNNTPGHILIQAEINGTELIFNFFGTSDNRKVEIDGPHIIERNSDGSMRTTFNQKVLDGNGEVLIDENFGSFYDSPSKYPHPGEEIFNEKPKDWSKKQWDAYKKSRNL